MEGYRKSLYKSLATFFLVAILVSISPLPTWAAAWYDTAPTWVDDNTIKVGDLTFTRSDCTTTNVLDNCRQLGYAGTMALNYNKLFANLDPVWMGNQPEATVNPSKYRLFTTNDSDYSIPIDAGGSVISYSNGDTAALGIVYSWDKPGQLALVSVYDNPDYPTTTPDSPKQYANKLVAPTNPAYTPAKLTVIPKGTVIQGQIKVNGRGGGEEPINSETVVKSLQVYLTVQGGVHLHLDPNYAGWWPDLDNMVKVTATSNKGVFNYAMKINDDIYADSSYIIESNNANKNLVSCIDGTADESFWGKDSILVAGAKGNLCTLTYHGSRQFSVDATGIIKMAPDATSWENNSNGINILHTTNTAGLNLTINETMDSPLDKAISSAIKMMLGGVTTGLKWTVGNINGLLVQTEDIIIGKANSTKPSSLNNAWISIRNIALSLLVMALVIIAFANVMQVDLEQYGLARMIPRIIISIIMAYLSWIIVIFFFDLCAAIQAQAMHLTSGIDILKSISNVEVVIPTSSQIITDAAILIVVIAVLIGVWICGIVLLFTLLLRIVMLAFLLVVAPLAFILNIMPFTASMYKQWWSEFFKWMFMGPIAFAIIALGGVIASSIGIGTGTSTQSLTDGTALNLVNSGGKGGVLIGLLIFGASLYMAATLPLQWGGKLMGAWAGAGKKLAGKAWGATGVAAGKFAWHRTGAQDFFAQRKANIAGMARSRGEILRSKVAGGGGSRLRSFAAGHSIINQGMARAQAEVAHDQMIEGKIKNEGLDKLDDQELKNLQRGAAVGSPLEEAIFTTRMKNGWTDNGLGENGEVKEDQVTFNRLAANNRSLVASARVAGKGRDLLLGSGNATWIGHAINDASKEEVQKWGADETHNLTKFAERGLTDSGLQTAMANGQTMDEALGTITGEYDQKIGALKPGETLSDTDTERYRDLRALKLTRSIEGGKMKRGFEQGGSAKSSYYAAANSEIFNEGAQAEIAAQIQEAQTGSRKGDGGGGSGGSGYSSGDVSDAQRQATEDLRNKYK